MPVTYRMKDYLTYVQADGTFVLAEFDGFSIRLIQPPAGSGNLDGPSVVFDNKLFLYSGGFTVAYDGRKIIKYTSPDIYDNGSGSFYTIFKNRLYFITTHSQKLAYIEADSAVKNDKLEIKKTNFANWETANRADYTINFPPDWVLDTASYRGQGFMLKPRIDDYSSANLTLAVQANLIDPKQELDMFYQSLSEESAYELQRKTQNNAEELIMKAKVSSPFVVTTYWFAMKKNNYMITYYVDPKFEKSYKLVIEGIINSFILK